MAGGQSPLLRTAQLSIALEEERMIVADELIVSGNPGLDNLSRMTGSQAQTFQQLPVTIKTAYNPARAGFLRVLCG